MCRHGTVIYPVHYTYLKNMYKKMLIVNLHIRRGINNTL